MQIMGDLFHPKVEDEWIDRIWYEMAGNPRHTYIMLTKRPENVVSYIERSHGGNYAWPDNWWMGTTCENQEQADNRIPILLSLKAQLSFVSVEPMLEPVDLRLWTERHPMGYFDGYTYTSQKPMLHWVICGAETGPGKRDMFPGWAHDLGYTCGMTGVPFFFKKDSQGNHELGGLIFEQYPEVSE